MVERILRCRELEDKEISIVFVSDDYIRNLNSKYRGIDKATDVLSFSQMDDESEGLVPQPLGDIVISVEKAKENAESFSVTLQEEILRLLIHGTMHLLGYDHEEESERNVMEKEEEVILNYLTA